MPPTDPRLCPDLEVARPDDFKGAEPDPGPFPEPWSLLFGGGSDTSQEGSSQDDRWQNASVTSRWFTPDGREIIQVYWSARGELWSEMYFAVEAKMIKRW